MKRFAFAFALLLTPLLNLSAIAHAFPIGDSEVLPPSPRAAAFDSPYDFQGIVALSNCSGSLVRFDDNQGGDRGLVLTNGHCTGRIAPGKARYKEAANRTFDLLDRRGARLGRVSATQLLYGTMTKTDMAIYELRESYDEIYEKFRIEPLTLSRDTPNVDTSIEIISGYWKTGYSCSIAAIAFGLQEGKWEYVDSIRYSNPGCEVKGGTSGSPVLEAGTRKVIAINNSGNQNGLKCLENNPCEIEADGTIVYQKGWNYAQQTYWLYSCRNASRAFDLTVDGCQLPK